MTKRPSGKKESNKFYSWLIFKRDLNSTTQRLSVCKLWFIYTALSWYTQEKMMRDGDVDVEWSKKFHPTREADTLNNKNKNEKLFDDMQRVGEKRRVGWGGFFSFFSAFQQQHFSLERNRYFFMMLRVWCWGIFFPSSTTRRERKAASLSARLAHLRKCKLSPHSSLLYASWQRHVEGKQSNSHRFSRLITD